MPQFIRKRRGWDWFTPAPVRHLPPGLRKRLTDAAWKNAGGQSKAYRFLPLLSNLPVLGTLACVWGTNYAVGSMPPDAALHISSVLFDVLLGFALIYVIYMLVLAALSRRFWSRYRSALRQELLNEGIRPAACFECRYYTEGFEGDECPNCGAALVAPKSTPPVETSEKNTNEPRP